MSKKCVNILNRKYKILHKTEDEDEFLVGLTGYVDHMTKEIVIKDDLGAELEAETIRHEVIHAYLYCSGLGFSTVNTNGGWSQNEEMVDWFAIQLPYIMQTLQELGVDKA